MTRIARRLSPLPCMLEQRRKSTTDKGKFWKSWEGHTHTTCECVHNNNNNNNNNNNDDDDDDDNDNNNVQVDSDTQTTSYHSLLSNQSSMKDTDFNVMEQGRASLHTNKTHPLAEVKTLKLMSAPINQLTSKVPRNTSLRHHLGITAKKKNQSTHSGHQSSKMRP